MSKRRRYSLALVVNGRSMHEVVIDPHYEHKHPEISDSIILELVKSMNGRTYEPSDESDHWQFFALDRIEYEGKRYRLVWCLEENSSFLGVINCFRR